MSAHGTIPLAYDVGLNNGDDTAYYLAKGWRVVAIDANPISCRRARERFRTEIDAGRLTILNVGVGDQRRSSTFYVNEAQDAISTFLPEKFAEQAWVEQKWTEVPAEVYPMMDLIAEHGEPTFAKIDVEFYDCKVLRDIQRSSFRPRWISVEVQELETFEMLMSLGYERFRIVVGETVPREFERIMVRHVNGSEFPYAFPEHSSGPFGEDLPGPWLDQQASWDAIRAVGPGWVDVHATSHGGSAACAPASE